MHHRADVPSSLITRSRLSRERIEYLDQADESIIGEIRCGVLFLMAFWSIHSCQAFTKLTEILSGLDPEGKLQCVVVNIDGVPATSHIAEFMGQISGAGEAAWIKEGRVVAISGPGFNVDRFATNTTALLAKCLESVPEASTAVS